MEDLARSDGRRPDPMEAGQIWWRSASVEPVGPALPTSLTLPLFISLTLPSPHFGEAYTNDGGGRDSGAGTDDLVQKVYFTYGILIY